jgi:hypothetical protein
VVDVWVTNLDSQLATLASGFTYVLPPPTISGVSPTTGPIGGGTSVTITGANFQNSATVTFAGVAATSATVNSSTRIAATTPAHAAGTAAVNVTNPDAQSATLPGAFTYTSGAITAGCGAGTDNSDCGNVGDPYEGGSVHSPCTGACAVTACGTLTTANSPFVLQNDVGSDPAAICFHLDSRNITLDLAGHTVTGRIDETGLYASGITIFNGTVNCSVAPLSVGSCIKISSSSAYTAKTRIHHVTALNSAEPGNNVIATIYLDWTGLDGTNTAIEVDHVTGYVQTALTSNRAEFMRVTTGKKVDIHNNDLTCNADVAACNPIEVVGAAGYVNGLIHHNRVTIINNTVSDGLPRAIVIAGPDSGSVGTQGWRVYNNICTANNGRCFRFRQVNDLQVHDNQVLNCAATMGYGCYHFADPSNGTAYVSDAQAVIYNETITLDTGGVGFWLRDGNGWTVRDVTVIGTHGKLGRLDTPLQAPPGGPVPTSATFCRITGASSLDTDSVANASTTVNIFDAGNWSGAGTINVLPSCP